MRLRVVVDTPNGQDIWDGPYEVVTGGNMLVIKWPWDYPDRDRVAYGVDNVIRCEVFKVEE